MTAVASAVIPPDLWFRAAVTLIEREPDAGRRAELREVFEHRAAVAEYDGGLSRSDAERVAFREIRQRIATPPQASVDGDRAEGSRSDVA